MDALSEHLESLASLGAWESEGVFTVARHEVWARLGQALPDGRASLRFLLRWLHARGAGAVDVTSDKGAYTLTVRAELRVGYPLPALPEGGAGGDDFDFSGADIDLARAAVAARMLGAEALQLEVPDDRTRWIQDFVAETGWKAASSEGESGIVASFRLSAKLWSLVEGWEREVRVRFRASPLALTWNGEGISGPFAFSAPVVIWRNLRRRERGALPLPVSPPVEAVESFAAVRHSDVDVVLGMVMEAGPVPAFQLLRHGELFDLPQAEREMAGFTGLIRGVMPLDLSGLQPVWSDRLSTVVESLKDEAVDMAVQLYRLEQPLLPAQAESVFVGMQSVLLHLLDHQRFVEGNLLANWLREKIAGGRVLKDFRAGYTFDRLCALLAEPAGEMQMSFRWAKQAEARVRESGSREVADEALLIAARLEIRARRDKPIGLSGDLQGRLAQLAARESHRGRMREAASIYGMIALAFAPGHPERLEFLREAVRCAGSPGDGSYTDLLAAEMGLRG